MDPVRLQQTLAALVSQVGALTQKVEEDQAKQAEFHQHTLERLDRLDQTRSLKSKEKAREKREIVDRVDKWMAANEAFNFPLMVKMKEEDKVTKEEREGESDHKEKEKVDDVETLQVDKDAVNIIKATENSRDGFPAAHDVPTFTTFQANDSSAFSFWKAKIEQPIPEMQVHDLSSLRNIDLEVVKDEVYESEAERTGVLVALEEKVVNCETPLRMVSSTTICKIPPSPFNKTEEIRKSIEEKIAQQKARDELLKTQSGSGKKRKGDSGAHLVSPVKSTIPNIIPKLWMSSHDANLTESSLLSHGENDADVDRKYWHVYHRRRRKSTASI